MRFLFYVPCRERPQRRKIRLIEGIAKCRHPQKIDHKGTWRQVFICLRAQNPVPPHCIVYSVFVNTMYLFVEEGGGGRVELKRRGDVQHRRVQIPKLGWKCLHDLIYARNWPSPVYKL
jgi:hypothetical protein